MKWPTGVRVAVILLLVSVVGSVAQAVKVCPSFYTVALPNYNGGAGLPGALYGGYPKVAGWNVVWTEWTPDPCWGFNKEIFLFDGGSTRQLTNTTFQFGNFGPFISDANHVVYVGDSGSAYDLFHYDITTSTTTQLTSSGSRWCTLITDFNDPCVALQVSDQWWGAPPPSPTFSDVDLWDGSMIITQNPCTFNVAPRVSNQWVAWQGTGPSTSWDIFLYNINLSTGTQLTKSVAPPYWYHYDPQLSGGYLAWWGTEGIQTKIYFSKLTSVSPSYSDIATSSSVQQPWVVISGPHVFYAWTDDVLGYGVFHYDYTQRPPVTTQIYNPTPPPPPPIWMCDSMHACKSHLIFATHDLGGPNYQVYLWDITAGGPLRQITTKAGNSSGPVYVQVYSRFFPPHGYVPVAVWEENLGGPTKAFMSTRPICASIPVGDFHHDCLVNQVDYAYMASYWMQQWPPGAGPIPSPDLNGDNRVDWTDVGILRSNWLKCNIQPPIHCGCGCIFP